MTSAVVKSYGWLHSMLLEGVRRLPISSRAFGPPKGLIPEMKVWIDRYQSTHPDVECWYRRIHDAVDVRYPPAQALAGMPALFGEDQNVQQPEIFLASIPRPRILFESGIIIAPDDYVFEQSCSWKSFFFTHDIEYNTLRRRLKPELIAGEYATIVSRHARSYFHWFTECLPRLCLLESLPSVPILVQEGLPDWQRESLNLLGISEDRLRQMPRGCYEVDQLYFPSFPGYAAFTGDWTFAFADQMLKWLRGKFCGTRTLNLNKRVYVSRQGVAHRRILNEDSVIAALEREGILVVDAGRLSIAEKISLFGDASLIIGAHGAGLTHTLFAPSGASLIEILDPVKLVSTYYQLAAAMDQSYWYLLADNQSSGSLPPEKVNPLWPFQIGVDSARGSRKGYDDLNIPVDELLRTIEAAAGRDASQENRQLIG